MNKNSLNKKFGFSALLFIWLSANSQTSDHCLAIMQKADSAIFLRKYSLALTKLRAYKICDPESSRKADDKIFRVFKLIEAERDAADSAKREAIKQTQIANYERNEALKKAESSRLLSIALQRNSTNPTVAVRLAERALNIDKENGSAIAVINDILSNNNTCYYYKVMKVSNSDIQSIDFSPDGKSFLTVSDGTISLWAIDGSKIFSRKTDKYITEGMFIPFAQNYDFLVVEGDGKITRYDKEFREKYSVKTNYFGLGERLHLIERFCVIGAAQDAVNILDLETGEQRLMKIPTIKEGYNPRAKICGLKIALSYLSVLEGQITKTIYLYDTLTKKIDTLGKDPNYQSLYFQKESGNLLVTLSDGSTIIFNSSGKLIEKESLVKRATDFFWKSYYITDDVRIAFSENEQMVDIENHDAISGFSKTLRDDTIFTFAYSPINNICITGNFKGEIKFWNLHGLVTKKYPSIKNSSFNEIEIEKSNNAVLLYAMQGEINILTRDDSIPRMLKDVGGVLQSACFYPNEKSILIGVAYKSFDVRQEQFVYDIPTLNKYDYAGNKMQMFNIVSDISAIAISRDGETIVSADRNGFVKRWTKNGKLTDSVFIDDGLVTCLAISADKKFIAMSVEGENKKAILYSNKKKLILKVSRSFITKIVFSKDGNYIYVGDDFNGLDKFNIKGKRITSFKDNVTSNAKGVLSLDLSKDDQFLLVTRKPASSGNTVSYATVLDSKTGKLIQTLKADTKFDMIRSAAFSSDSKYILTLHENGLIKKWYTTKSFLNSNAISNFNYEEKRLYNLN